MKAVENYDKIAFEIFASLHPVEAFEKWPNEFMKYMKKKGYTMTKKQVKEMIKELD